MRRLAKRLTLTFAAGKEEAQGCAGLRRAARSFGERPVDCPVDMAEVDVPCSTASTPTSFRMLAHVSPVCAWCAPQR